MSQISRRSTHAFTPGGEDFPYWLKRASGASAPLRGTPRFGPPALRAPRPRRAEQETPEPKPGRHGSRRLSPDGPLTSEPADPIGEDLHAGNRPQGRCASRSDGLRPPLTPATSGQASWLSGRWLSLVVPDQLPDNDHQRGRTMADDQPRFRELADHWVACAEGSRVGQPRLIRKRSQVQVLLGPLTPRRKVGPR